MKIRNLTPHFINIVDEAGDYIANIQPDGVVARCVASTVNDHDIDFDGITIPITKTEMGAVENLPDPEPDTLLIVSMIVAKVCPDRTDLVIPNEAVRNGAGQIIGCKSLGLV